MLSMMLRCRFFHSVRVFYGFVWKVSLIAVCHKKRTKVSILQPRDLRFNKN